MNKVAKWRLFLLLVFLLLLPVISYPVLAQSKQTDQIDQLTNNLKSSKQQLDIVSIVPEIIPGAKALQQNRLNNVIAIAGQRKDALLKEIQTNPQNFLNKAALFKDRDKYPKEVQEYLEKEVEAEGTFSVIHLDNFTDPSKSRFEYSLDFNKGSNTKLRYGLHFIKDPPSLLSRSKVKVKGLGVSYDLVVQSGRSSAEKYHLETITPAAVPLVDQNKRAAVLMVNFRTDPNNKPFTNTQLNQLVFGTSPPSVSHYYRENSFYGQAGAPKPTWFSGPVYGWLTIDSSPENCNQIISFTIDGVRYEGWGKVYYWVLLADRMARTAGYDVSYGHRVYVFPQLPGCDWGGLGELGGNITWLNITQSVLDPTILNNTAVANFSHELGHNLGLMHADRINCLNMFQGEDLDISSPENCQPTPGGYGDNSSMMGGIYPNTFQFSALLKKRLGFFTTAQVQTIIANGEYDIYPSETLGGIKLLKIPIPGTGNFYFLEYRKLIGYDANLPITILSGPQIRIWVDPDNPAALNIDTKLINSPNILGFNIASGKGNAFYDEKNRIYIKRLPGGYNAGEGKFDYIKVLVKLDGKPKIEVVVCKDANNNGSCNTGEPKQSGATVTATKTGTGTTVTDTTNSEGEAELEVAEEGEYEVEVEGDPEGYTDEPQSVHVDFASLGNPQVALALTAQPIVAACSVSPNPVAAGQNVTWAVSNPSGGNGSYAYSWSGADGLSGSSQTVGKSYSTSGSKTASVRITSGSQSVDINCPSLTVNSVAPAAGVPYCSTGVSNITANSTTGNISTSNMTGITQTQWILNDYPLGIPDPANTISRVISPLPAGEHRLKTRVNYSAGWTDCANEVRFTVGTAHTHYYGCNTSGSCEHDDISGTTSNSSCNNSCTSQTGTFQWEDNTPNPGCESNGNAHIALNWTPASGTRYYEVWRIIRPIESRWYCLRGNDGSECDSGALPADTTNYTDNNLPIYSGNDSLSYSYFIRAINSSGSSSDLYSSTSPVRKADNGWVHLDSECQPDLIPLDLGITPANPSAGETVNITADVKNQGLGAKPYRNTITRLCLNSICDGYDPVLDKDTGRIALNSSERKSWDNLASATLKSGANTLSVCADYHGWIREANNLPGAGPNNAEENNCRQLTYEVTSVCNPDQAGSNQLTGCIWKKGGDVNFSSDTPLAVAPASANLTTPVPDNVTVLDRNWDASPPPAPIASDNFSVKWRGNFTFKKGTYIFTAGSDDGIRVKFNGVTKLDKWTDRIYIEDIFTQTFTAPTTVLVEVEYYDNTGSARVKFGWKYNHSISGYVRNSQTNAGIANVWVRVQLGNWDQYRDVATNTEGKFTVEGFVPNGDAYAVRIITTPAPAGYAPAKTVGGSHTWNGCLNRDTTSNDTSYECQTAGSQVDCAGSNVAAGIPPGRCSFTYTPVIPEVDLKVWGSAPDVSMLNFFAQNRPVEPRDTSAISPLIVTAGHKAVLNWTTSGNVTSCFLKASLNEADFNDPTIGSGNVSVRVNNPITDLGTSLQTVGAFPISPHLFKYTLTCNNNGVTTVSDSVYIRSQPACDESSVGINQFSGCIGNWESGSNSGIAYITHISAPLGAAAGNPVEDSFTPLDVDWNLTSPDFEALGYDNDTFYAIWKGRFNFKRGTYLFTAGSDDGIQVYINNQQKLSVLYPRGFVEDEDHFTHTFTEDTTAEVQVLYYDYIQNARIKLKWQYIPDDCNNTTPIGTNQFTGCLYDGTNFETQKSTAPSSLVAASPVADNFTPLNFNWGNSSPDVSTVGTDTFSVRWKGIFNFPSGLYSFTAGSDDGIRVKINGRTVLDRFISRPSYTLDTFSHTFWTLSSATLIEVDYFENTGDARVLFGWQRIAPPVITSANPNIGPGRGGTNITISGSNFAPGATITMWGNPAINVNVVNSSTITARTPGLGVLGDVTGDNRVTNLDALCTLRKVALLPDTSACSASGYTTEVDMVVRNPDGGMFVFPTGAFTYQHADVNGSGTVTGLDALCILRIVAGLPVTTFCSPPASAAALAALNAPKAPACNVSGSNIGDVDGNGKVTEDDLKLITGKIFNLPDSGLNTIQTRRADVNGDNRIDDTDAYLLADYLSNNNPAVFPICKTTPTPIPKPTPNPTVTPTPAPIKPAIVSVSVSDLSASQVKVSWTTNTASTSQVMYGNQINKLDQSSAFDKDLAVAHSVILTKLAPNKVYYFKVKSTNSAGSIESAVKIFKTKP